MSVPECGEEGGECAVKEDYLSVLGRHGTWSASGRQKGTANGGDDEREEESGCGLIEGDLSLLNEEALDGEGGSDFYSVCHHLCRDRSGDLAEVCPHLLCLPSTREREEVACGLYASNHSLPLPSLTCLPPVS